MSIFNQSNPTPHPSAQVLVIEDDSGVQQLIETVLRRHGFSVLLAGTGRTGLRQVHERPPGCGGPRRRAAGPRRVAGPRAHP